MRYFTWTRDSREIEFHALKLLNVTNHWRHHIMRRTFSAELLSESVYQGRRVREKYAGLKVWELTSMQASKCPLKPRTLLRREADAILPTLVSHLFGGLVQSWATVSWDLY